MKKYLVLSVESRGEIYNTSVIESDLDVEDFCDKLLKEKLIEHNVNDEDYINEFSSVFKTTQYYEVNITEELGYDVYELK